MKMFKGEIHWKDDYRLVVEENCFKVYDNKDDKVYYEDSNGFWVKRQYDENGNVIYYEDVLYNGTYWFKREYDNQGNEIYYENKFGYWVKHQYDENEKLIYYENSNGKIINKRKAELTLQQIADKFGVRPENLKIKK